MFASSSALWSAIIFVWRTDTVSGYHISIFHSDEDGGHVAVIPDLIHCSAFGTSAEEALREVMIAKAAWLAAAREQRKPIPEPSHRPVICQAAG